MSPAHALQLRVLQFEFRFYAFPSFTTKDRLGDRCILCGYRSVNITSIELDFMFSFIFIIQLCFTFSCFLRMEYSTYVSRHVHVMKVNFKESAVQYKAQRETQLHLIWLLAYLVTSVDSIVLF